ncbi:MAG: AAA family ATPase [Caldilineaceae bacterium]
METVTTLAEWIRRRRKALDLTQSALAQRVGCAVVTLKKIEQETRRPSRELAELLAEQLAIPATEREVFLRLARGEYVEATPAPVDVPPPPAFLQVSSSASTPSSFVARARELAQLEAHLVATLNGSGRIVFVSGEAGRGKTALMTEFARRAQERISDLVVANGNCDAYAGVGDPYLPFRDVLALLTGDVEAKWKAGALSQEQARRLWSLLPRTVQALVDHGPDLLDLFIPVAGLRQRANLVAPQQAGAWSQLQTGFNSPQPRTDVPQQRQIFEQYTQVLCALAAHHPLLLVFDDLQWIDAASAGLLFHLGLRLAGTRLLILAAYRPSEVPLDLPQNATPGHPLTPIVLEFQRRYGDIKIDLGDVAPESGRAFVDALLDRDANQLDEAFRAALFQRTQGYPLFTVELVREMQARRDLIQDGAGCWIQGASVDWEALPARVEAVIARRLGRLPSSLQEALKIASVVGETFTAEVVARVQGADEQPLVRQLGSIVDRHHRLVTSQGNERLGQQALSHYRFGHILFQKYLYETLDPAERVYLHEAVGTALEAIYGDHAAQLAAQLAYHFQAAGLTLKAVEYLYQAGERAAKVSAHQEAITHLANGLALLKTLPAPQADAHHELRLQIALGISIAAVKGWSAPEAGHAYERARHLAEALGERSQLGSILWGLYVFYTVRGRLYSALALGEQCVQLAREQADAPLLVVGHFMVGTPSFHLGRLPTARTHLEQGTAAYLPEKHPIYVTRYGPDFGVFTACYQSHLLWYLGYPEEALRHCRATLALAAQLAHPYSLVLAQSYAAMLHQFRREPEAAQACAEAVLALHAQYEFSYYGAWATVIRGWAVAEQGGSAAGIAQMQQGLAALRGMESGLRESYYLSLMAEIHAKAGQVEQGLKLLDEAQAFMHGHDERCHAAELYRLQGELRHLQGETDEEVEKYYDRAIAIARQQQAKSLELRAVMSLSRLRQRQGQAVTAQQALTAIYTWFTEGFDTRDLQEAKGLLDQLLQL